MPPRSLLLERWFGRTSTGILHSFPIYSVDAYLNFAAGVNFSIKTLFTKPTRPNWQRKCDVRLKSLAVNLVESFLSNNIFFGEN